VNAPGRRAHTPRDQPAIGWEDMNLFHLKIAAALAATISLAACVAPPAAPTIPVVLGPNKTFDRFDADQATCQKYAAVQNISRGGRC